MTLSQVIRLDKKDKNTVVRKIKEWERKNAEKEERYEKEQAALLDGQNQTLTQTIEKMWKDFRTTKKPP
tara:strand:+ start:58 stop:264 length:207 start_codon:yes stop_codon:yes gene_type:complete